MIGKWKGFYKYEKQAIQDRIGFDKTNFTISIEAFENNRFKGKVEDDIFTKGTPGVGTIEGSINGEKVKFVKRMPVKAAISKTGKIVTFKRTHTPIYYEGTFTNDRKSIKGTWKMKISFSMIGFLAIFLPTKGYWQMDFVEED